MNVIRHWIAYIFKIPWTSVIYYEKDGRKITKIITTVGKKTRETTFQVEHLLDDNLAVTEQTLRKEKRIFTKIYEDKRIIPQKGQT